MRVKVLEMFAIFFEKVMAAQLLSLLGEKKGQCLDGQLGNIVLRIGVEEKEGETTLIFSFRPPQEVYTTIAVTLNQRGNWQDEPLITGRLDEETVRLIIGVTARLPENLQGMQRIFHWNS